MRVVRIEKGIGKDIAYSRWYAYHCPVNHSSSAALGKTLYTYFFRCPHNYLILPGFQAVIVHRSEKGGELRISRVIDSNVFPEIERGVPAEPNADVERAIRAERKAVLRPDGAF